MLEILIFEGIHYYYDVNVRRSEVKKSNISNAQ